jgi:hypothetical protein
LGGTPPQQLGFIHIQGVDPLSTHQEFEILVLNKYRERTLNTVLSISVNSLTTVDLEIADIVKSLVVPWRMPFKKASSRKDGSNPFIEF